MENSRSFWTVLLCLFVVWLSSSASLTMAGSHVAHFGNDRGPLLAQNEDGCLTCHASGRLQCQDEGPVFADGNFLPQTHVCDTCHSPDGAFDGVNDAVIGAKANWNDGVYESDGKTFRAGKEQWCAGCHDDDPGSSRQAAEVIVDNPDAVFYCTWGTSASGGYNGDYRWHAGGGDGSCKATWTPNLPVANTYNVRAWWKASSNRATDAKYTIYYEGGSETVVVNQEINGNQWNLLGSYPFAAGTSGYVVLNDDANEYVIADAVKFDEVSINAPTISGDDTTYGFYVNGHKINCLFCHDASKKHIDHEHRTYELDENNGNAVVNPYSNSYRLKGTYSKPSEYLCFECHNSSEVLGQDMSDVSHTNFWNNDSINPNPDKPGIQNSHWLHFVEQTGIQFDSDWDGAIDSAPRCVACHNVHGSATKPMIRHGELISTYGTTDKVPALNFAYLVEPTEFDTATWAPNLDDDDYSVYAWWKAHSNRATNATYTIYYDGGSDTVAVNQQTNGSQWNLLGRFPFAAGTSGYVMLSNEGANGYVIADAVGWDTDGDETPDTIIDNGDPEFFSIEGDWGTSASGGYDNDSYRWHAKPTPDIDENTTLEESVGGRMSLPGPGVAQNGVCWACHSGYSYERAPYLGPKVIMGKAEPGSVPNDIGGTSLITAFVSDPDGNLSSVMIDLTPIGGSAIQPMNDAGDGYYSYQVTIQGGTPEFSLTFVITATDGASTSQETATLVVIDPNSIYVDNLDAEFECDWGTSTSSGYGDDYRWRAAGDGSCTATWTPDLPAAGTYNVYAWWKASSNRATDAPYTIYYNGGSTTVDVNQQVNGDQWFLLGTYPFVAGTSGYVVLSDDANQYVIADAVKFEP